jgi:Reverse transcriptase (RNA-dependent DNA polymerase)
MDKKITQIMLTSEKNNCSKKDQTMWTPEIKQSNLRIQYWNIKKKAAKQHICVTTRLQIIKGQMDQESLASVENNKRSLSAAYNNEIKQHKILCANNVEKRREYLTNKMNDLNERDKGRTTIKQLLHREQNRNNFSIIKRALKPKHSKGIKYLDVPDEQISDVWHRITDQRVIEEKLLERNTTHFEQAKDTPFAQPNLLNLYGYRGVNQNAKDLIEKNLVPEEIKQENKYVQQFVKKLGDGKLIDIDEEISFDEFKTALDKWRERTTTSPSGRHLGHYKLIIRLKICDETNENIDISDILLKTYYFIAMTAIKLGQPLERWTEITTCMIEKIPGVSRINKLRVIHLFECDYNLILKVMWARKAIWAIHSNNLLNCGQSGSRPGCRSIDVALNKEMKYNYSRLTRTPLITIDNDAKSCFDRILCNVAMLVSKYFGISENYCKLQSKNLKESKFRIRTALGDSKQTYQHKRDSPIFGTGQGSCASPAIWLLISSFIMDLLELSANGMSIEDIKPQLQLIKQWIDGFVDDTSIFTNLEFGNENIMELLRKAEHDGQTWECLLNTTGGELELSKCFYYILSCKWDKWGNPTPQSIAEQQLEK